MIKENQFRDYYEFPKYIGWLNNKEKREGNDYMLVVTDLINQQKYPVFCPSSLLEETRAEYDNRDKMSRVDMVIQLQNQQEQEKYTKTYLKAFEKTQREEMENVNL